MWKWGEWFGADLNRRRGLGAFALADVALVVEVAEEQDEAEAVGKHNRIHGVGEITLCEQVIASVCGQKYKLELKNKKTKHIFKTSSWKTLQKSL